MAFPRSPRGLISGFRLPALRQRNRQSGRMAVRNRFDDARALLHGEAGLIIDGGASIGNTVARFLDSFPGATIHAFEPNPNALVTLRRRYEGVANVAIHPQALGASEGRVQLLVLERESASSILRPTAFNAQYHPAETHLKSVVEVAQTRLDTAIDGELDVLKLDLQGYELEALRGAEGLLPRTKIVMTEVEFIALYENQPVFSDIDQYLRNLGFRLYNLYELWTQGDGQLTAGDALYINTRCPG